MNKGRSVKVKCVVLGCKMQYTLNHKSRHYYKNHPQRYEPRKYTEKKCQQCFSPISSKRLYQHIKKFHKRTTKDQIKQFRQDYNKFNKMLKQCNGEQRSRYEQLSEILKRQNFTNNYKQLWSIQTVQNFSQQYKFLINQLAEMDKTMLLQKTPIKSQHHYDQNVKQNQNYQKKKKHAIKQNAQHQYQSFDNQTIYKINNSQLQELQNQTISKSQKKYNYQMELLQKKSALFLTSGFSRPYVFQVITSYIQTNQNNRNQKDLIMVISDGQIYISCVYPLKFKNLTEIQKCQNLNEFDLIQIIATYKGANKSILIQSLEIVSTDHRGLYGKVPISMQDYLISKMFSSQKHNDKSNDQQQIAIDDIQKKMNNNNFSSYQEKSMNSTQQKCPQNIQIQIDSKNNYFQPISNQNNVSFNNLNRQIFQTNDKQLCRFQLQDDLQSQEQFLKAVNNRSKQIRQSQNSTTNLPNKRVKTNQKTQSNKKYIEHLTHKGYLVQSDQKNKIDKQYDIYQGIFDDSVNNSLQQTQAFNSVTQATQIRTIQVDVINLQDNMVTQKQKITINSHHKSSNKRRKQLEQIFQSQQKSNKKPLSNDIQIEIDEKTIPKSQQINKSYITPIKTFTSCPQNSHNLNSSILQKLKILNQYNILISNLYQGNNNFKLICRVNNIYQWKAKTNGLHCLGVTLIDIEGNQIKGIVYINHSIYECSACSKILQVGKVYSFQNGQCKKNSLETRELQLVFNLRSYEVVKICNGKNKISLRKNFIEPFNQSKLLSLSEVVEMYEGGKQYTFSTYGLLHSFKARQYGSSRLNESSTLSSQQNSSEIVKSDKQDEFKQKQKPSEQCQSRIYINGCLLDPILKRRISFNLMITRPSNQSSLSTQQFLEKNMIKRGCLVILHNMKLEHSINLSSKKIIKTKRSYLQIIGKQQTLTKGAISCQTIPISLLAKTCQIFSTMLSYTPFQLQQILNDPHFLDISSQPYTSRSISQMNELLNNSILPDQYCHSQINNVRLFRIQYKRQVQICFYCMKKVYKGKCAKCGAIDRKFIYVFGMVFSDNTASFQIQVIQHFTIQMVLGIHVNQYLRMDQQSRYKHLQLVKYNEFKIKIKSQKKVGGIYHKITGITRHDEKPCLNQIKVQKKGLPKHFKKLQSSW